MLNRIRIGPRLMLAFALMSALVAGMGFIAVWKMESINANTQYFAINVVPSFRNLHQIALELGDVREYENRYVLADTAAEMDSLDVKIAESRRKIDVLFEDHLKEWISDLEDQGWLDRCRNSVNLHLQGWPALRELARQKLQRTGKGAVQSTAALEALKGSSTKTYDAAQDMMDKWWDYNVRLTEETTSEAAATYVNTRVLVLEILAGCVLLSVILAVLITRSIVQPLSSAVEVAQAAANGDLTVRPQVSGSDEVAQLLQALRQMNDGLSTIVSEVRNAGDSIATGSAQIASGNTDLSQRTEEQAASLEETSASMLEIRSSMVRNADSAQQSVQLANSTSHTAQQGGVAMQQVISSMREINAGAKKITDIISVIDGITFQINILALNAAVEAARAGEQGKGFAVVASEVRTLAQRSAESAREIRHLINASVEQIESGSRQVEEAGAAMQGIVSEVNTVAHFITEIGVAMSEQTSAFNQITESVSQLDQVTQQNAALVEESAVAASSLRDQADLMIDVVSRFKLLAEYGNAIKGFADTAPYGDHTRNMRAMAASKKAASASYVRPRKGVSRYANVETPPVEGVSKSAPSGEQNKATHDSEWQTF